MLRKDRVTFVLLLRGDDMKEYLKKYWIYGVLGLVLVILLIIPNEKEPVDAVSNPTIIQEETLGFIYVDLKGEVKNPGVYKLESDSRLFQVITLAGGLTENANVNAINMSILLKDQMSIYIPSIFDEVDTENTHIDVPDDGKININQANGELFETLPGIGPSTAANIIEYRDEHGYFNVIEDIMNVPNIGEATFEQIKDLITVEE